MKYCKQLCDDCPFSRRSIRGFLADYEIQDFHDMMRMDFPFPCHKHMPKDGLGMEEVKEGVERGDLPICRGYIESIIKSAKSPYMNKDLQDAVHQVRKEGVVTDSMNIFDFINHHEI